MPGPKAAAVTDVEKAPRQRDDDAGLRVEARGNEAAVTFRTGSGTSTKGNTSGRNEGSHVEAALGAPCGPDKQPSNNVLKLLPPPVHHKSGRPPQ